MTFSTHYSEFDMNHDYDQYSIPNAREPAEFYNSTSL